MVTTGLLLISVCVHWQMKSLWLHLIVLTPLLLCWSNGALNWYLKKNDAILSVVSLYTNFSDQFLCCICRYTLRTVWLV